MTAKIAEAVYRSHSKSLHRYLMHRLANAQNAQDLAQDAYLRLVRLDEAALVRAPQAYVFRIASNLVYELRHNKRRNPVTFDSCLADAVSQSTSDPRTMEPAEYLDVQQHINALLEQLPPLYAVIVVMKKRDGLSMEEIAHELGLSIHTVKKYLSKALAQIRAHLTH